MCCGECCLGELISGGSSLNDTDFSKETDFSEMTNVYLVSQCGMIIVTVNAISFTVIMHTILKSISYKTTGACLYTNTYKIYPVASGAM